MSETRIGNNDFLIIVIAMLTCVGLGIGMGHAIWGNNDTHIAPSYALDNNGCAVFQDKTMLCPIDSRFDAFWQEATKNTTFTIEGKPVEITDVQIFYKTPEGSICVSWGEDKYKTCSPMLMPWATHSNITYYPLGVENSQTYVAPTSTPCPKCWELENDSMFEGNISLKWIEP